MCRLKHLTSTAVSCKLGAWWDRTILKTPEYLIPIIKYISCYSATNAFSRGREYTFFHIWGTLTISKPVMIWRLHKQSGFVEYSLNVFSLIKLTKMVSVYIIDGQLTVDVGQQVNVLTVRRGGSGGWIFQQARDIKPLLLHCWARVVDCGLTLNQQWLNISCLLRTILLTGQNNLRIHAYWLKCIKTLKFNIM